MIIKIFRDCSKFFSHFTLFARLQPDFTPFAAECQSVIYGSGNRKNPVSDGSFFRRKRKSRKNYKKDLQKTKARNIMQYRAVIIWVTKPKILARR